MWGAPAATGASGWGAPAATSATTGWGAPAAAATTTAATGWGAPAAATGTATGGWGAPAAPAANAWGAPAATANPVGWGTVGTAGATGLVQNIGDLRGNKRYADLEPEVKKALEFVEKRFQLEKSVIESNKRHLAAPLLQLDRDLKTVEGKLDQWMEHLERQYEQVQEFRAAVNSELRSAETAYFLL